MSEHKHTPGPWILIRHPHDPIGFSINEPVFGCIAERYTDERLMDDERVAVTIANGQLIAAAPDMLAALKAIVDSSDERFMVAMTVPRWLLAQAQDAIARAEGKKK